MIKEKKKNVHAFVMPLSYKHLSKRASSKQSVEGLREIYYNPYKYNSFVYKDTGEGLEGKFIQSCQKPRPTRGEMKEWIDNYYDKLEGAN